MIIRRGNTFRDGHLPVCRISRIVGKGLAETISIIGRSIRQVERVVPSLSAVEVPRHRTAARKQVFARGIWALCADSFDQCVPIVSGDTKQARIT